MTLSPRDTRGRYTKAQRRCPARKQQEMEDSRADDESLRAKRTEVGKRREAHKLKLRRWEAIYKAELRRREDVLAIREAELAIREAELAIREAELAIREAELRRREDALAIREAELRAELRRREDALATRRAEIH